MSNRNEIPAETKDFLDWLFEQLLNATNDTSVSGDKNPKEVCSANHNNSRG